MQTKEGKKFKISLEWYSEGAVPPTARKGDHRRYGAPAVPLKQEIYAPLYHSSKKFTPPRM